MVEQRRPDETTPAPRWWLRGSAALLLALALALAACTTEPTGTPDEAVEDANGEAADDTATGDDVEGNEEPEDTTDEPPPEEDEEQPVASSDGTGTATVGGEEYQFRVINCLQDVEAPLTGGQIPLLVEGVPPDAPDDLVDPLRGTLTQEEIEELGVEGMQELSAPVLAYGPLLGVTRVEDDGESDLLSLQFEDGAVYQSDFGGFIEVAGSGEDLTVTATATVTASNIEDPESGGSEVGEMTVQVTC